MAFLPPTGPPFLGRRRLHDGYRAHRLRVGPPWQLHQWRAPGTPFQCPVGNDFSRRRPCSTPSFSALRSSDGRRRPFYSLMDPSSKIIQRWNDDCLLCLLLRILPVLPRILPGTRSADRLFAHLLHHGADALSRYDCCFRCSRFFHPKDAATARCIATGSTSVRRVDTPRIAIPFAKENF